MSQGPVATLLKAAAEGDQSAWDALVERYARLVWSVVRGFRLDDAAAHDVFQTVWLRLVEHVDRIREPERLPGWLSMTAKNECIRVLKRQRRQIPSDFEFDVADPTSKDFAEPLIDLEALGVAMEAFEQLSPEHQQLMRLLCADPPLDYETIASIIDRPIGSIGPTRARCIAKLRAIIGEES
jgi:RNA polymerase sigma factor (sigma-70 family)